MIPHKFIEQYRKGAEYKRKQRDKLLSDSDWVVIKAKETGTNIPSGWKTYRQALRDLPQQEGFPNVEFPEKPTS